MNQYKKNGFVYKRIFCCKEEEIDRCLFTVHVIICSASSKLVKPCNQSPNITAKGLSAIVGQSRLFMFQTEYEQNKPHHYPQLSL